MSIPPKIKPALHLTFAAALLFCFAGAALSHFQHGHTGLGILLTACGILYVSQALRRYQMSLRNRS